MLPIAIIAQAIFPSTRACPTSFATQRAAGQAMRKKGNNLTHLASLEASRNPRADSEEATEELQHAGDKTKKTTEERNTHLPQKILFREMWTCKELSMTLVPGEPARVHTSAAPGEGPSLSSIMEHFTCKLAEVKSLSWCRTGTGGTEGPRGK